MQVRDPGGGERPMADYGVISDVSTSLVTLPTDPERVRLSLIQGFRLSQEGRSVVLPLGAQRLIAFLALQNRAVLRVVVAGNLWLDKPERVACASLRSALWQLRRS